MILSAILGLPSVSAIDVVDVMISAADSGGSVISGV